MNLRNLIFLILISISLFAQDKVQVPELKKFVIDSTNTLESAEIKLLEGKLSTLAKLNGAQVVLIIIPNTGNSSIEEFALKIAEKNRIGREEKDDGVVFLISKENQSLRIEVGYGLEGVLTDADCKRILAKVVSPKLKYGNFFEAINLGVDAIILKINGSPIIAESTANSMDSKKGKEFDKFFPAFIVLMIGYFLHFVFGFIISASFAGLSAFLIGPLMMGFSLSETFMLAIALFFISFIFNLFTNLFIESNSSSSTGKDFIGGGGSFGGGGASGNW